MIKIMVVDDHAIFREGIVSLLNSVDGWEVVGESGSGAAAVRLASELNPDIIIMDITMPDMDGIKAARQIKEAGINSGIILLTMHKDIEIRNAAEECGINGYLLKDDAFVNLVYAIKAVLRGEIVALVAEGLSSRAGIIEP